MTAYAEFRLRIKRGTSARTFRVEASGLGGEAPGRFKLPFTETELENFVLKIGRTRRGVRRIESPEMELAKKFGARLFSAVMDEGIGELYRAAFSEARAAGQGLRVTLSLTDVPELGAIPWEYMYDPPNFLSISTLTPVVRYLDLPRPRRALAIELPIRILGVVSAPTDAETLNVELERAKLDEALKPLKDAGAVTIDWLEDANLLALARKMRHDTYHILHYIGHGGFDDTSGEGALLFEDEFGRGKIVSGDQLGTILYDKQALRLVLLNSCEGARNSVKDPFSGVAASLVEREIPAVIGMQFEITDRAAVLFAAEFYSMVAEGQPVDSALAEARLAIFADHNDVEWGTPVLFMRVADGRLFDVTNATAIPRVDPEELISHAEAVIAEVAPAAPTEVAVEPEPAAEPVPVAEPEPEPAPEPAPEPEPVPIRQAEPVVELERAPEPEPELTTKPEPLPVPENKPEPQPPPPARRVPWLIVGIGAAAVFILGLLAILRPTATITIQIGAAAGSRDIGVVGSNFQAGETVDIAIDGVKVADVVTSASGAFSKTIDVGDRERGVIVATGSSSNRQASIPFSLARSRSIEPSGEPSGAASGAPPVALAPGILFYSNFQPGSDETDNELYLIDPLGGEPKQLTFNHVDDTFPAWSPDYKRIVFTRGSSRDGDIYILEPNGTETPLVSGDTNDTWPSWSPDGWIAFIRKDPDATAAIWKVRIDGSGAQELYDGLRLRAPVWSPNGKTLAFDGYVSGGNYDIATVGADGSNFEQLTKNPGLDVNPAWSPDGNSLLFVSEAGTGNTADHELYVLDLTTRAEPRRLTTNDVRDGNPAWSPDGSRITFYRAARDGYQIWVMNADGTGERNLMPNRARSNLDPAWR